jgi:chaperonin GroES
LSQERELRVRGAPNRQPGERPSSRHEESVRQSAALFKRDSAINRFNDSTIQRFNEFPSASADGILIQTQNQKNQRKNNQTMALNVKPLGDRILVEPVEEKEVKKGGIIIPDTAKEKPMESLVVALGTGKTDDSGKKLPFEVKKGDRVLCSKYGGTELKLDGKEYKILSSDDILAVIE